MQLNKNSLLRQSSMHAHLVKRNLGPPDVTCPIDATDNERREEVVHHQKVPGQLKQKKSSDDKRSTFTIKAKSIPVTPPT